MKILLINKFFFPLGGTEKYVFDLRQALLQLGHEVAEFSMQHPDNRASPYAEYFVPELSFDPLAVGFWGKVGLGFQVIYSRTAARRLGRLIRDFKPDLAHLHNIHFQLTPSILFALRRARVPIVWTLHDLHLICSSHIMYDHERGGPCEACRGGKFHRAISRECLKHSALAGLAGAVEAYLYHALGIYRRWVDLYLAPSRFLRELMAAEGLPAERLVHLPNYTEPDRIRAQFEGEGYGLYAGRLSQEKGVLTLLRALAKAPDLPFYFLGNGPLAFQLRREADELGLKQVRFLGRQQGGELEALRRRAAFVVVPSECYENCPFAVLEAFTAGKAVLGSRIGGIPELVREGETGRLFPPGDVEALAAGLLYFAGHPQAVMAWGRKARAAAENEYAFPLHLKRLLELYQRAARKDFSGKEVTEPCPSGTRSLPSATGATRAA
jgi:glycosyltransferase involved in cell wall biosynthesis